MIPEIGHFALILALALAVAQGVVPLLGDWSGNSKLIAVARPAAYGQFLFIVIAFGILIYAFISGDFSVKYVASNSNTQLPIIYRVSAVWGAHEGSLLLWTLFLSGWTVAVALFSRSLPDQMAARVIAIMGLVSIGFFLFMLFTSNPFDRLFPIPQEGRELNPLLQDPGLALHPPMLYMGYVGFSVAFAFVIAALISGQLDVAWARWSRPWTAMAWVFLTAGITLGSWWAYYELGWGGWWFWDPVENASFMPWLVGTALLHSLAVTEKRNAFRHWTVLLAIGAFSLSLLGTFLVRSGVLTSVHAFATDPTRGSFILVFLAIIVGGSFTLYALRAPQLAGGGRFDLVSRESLLLSNNILLVAATATVLLGTIYPLVLDALGEGKISVGPPYFNSVFVPIMVPLILFMGLGPISRWKKDSTQRLTKQLRLLLLLSIVVAAIVTLLSGTSSYWSISLGVVLAVWAFSTALKPIFQRLGLGGKKPSERRSIPLSVWGMSIAHIGIAIFIIGATFSTLFEVERDVRVEYNNPVELAGYTFVLKRINSFRGPNYDAVEGEVELLKEGVLIEVLKPQKRNYSTGMPMSEAAIDPGVTRDIYVALGDPLDENAWSMRLYYKPFIRWIWFGGVFMSLGGLLAAFDRRYRLKRLRRQPNREK
ncbi:MAG: heme lyase CcmF/NrfE family subunit [Arenicellales bacterium]|nr:heme lyase CcmF/NrfE family subunit [Arenicellales bacterium]MDP7521977.1 heme lyase CcmF/NrfE family subunit [Arenicellales bacterium]